MPDKKIDNKEDILQTFRRKIRAGHPAGELKNELLGIGYSSEEVDEIFNIISGSYKSADNKSLSNEKYPVLKLIGISLIIVGLAINSVSFYGPMAGYVLIIAGVFMLLPSVFELMNREIKRKD